MYVIEVIPLSRGSQVESLTYYSSTPYDVGVIISVPVRSKEVRALVVKRRSVSAAKAAVRAATFSLRKLEGQERVRPLPPVLIETAKTLSSTHPASLGAILFAMLPEEVRDGTQELLSNLPCIGIYESPSISVLQALYEERIRTYRSRVREAFAHRGSVLFVVPTSVEAELIAETLSQGIENRIVLLHGQLTDKKKVKAYEAFNDLSHAKLIITTPSHSFLDRHDITHIIVEQSRSPFYKAKTRPYLDVREGLKVLAKCSGRQLILGDLLPSSEDEWWRREDLYLTENEHPKRIAFDAKLSIIKQSDKPRPNVPFLLYSPKLLDAIKETVTERKKTFIYAARRGLAPVVVCIDCGHIFRCPDSGTPYSLLRTKSGEEEDRWFVCSTSGKREKAADVCPDCGSWRLKERGIGIQHMHDELTTLLPEANVLLFDHTTANTKTKAQKLMAEFYDTKGAILLGTAMALPYLEKPVTLSAIPSLDAARAIPSWRADEEFFSLLLRLREKTTTSLIIQTRSEVDDVLTNAKGGYVDQFYTDELALRQALHYPPFAVFVHLTIAGTREAVAALEAKVTEQLTAWKPHFYAASLSTPKKTTRYGLIRVPAEVWPNEELATALSALHPSVRIEINPQRIV